MRRVRASVCNRQLGEAHPITQRVRRAEQHTNDAIEAQATEEDESQLDQTIISEDPEGAVGLHLALSGPSQPAPMTW